MEPMPQVLTWKRSPDVLPNRLVLKRALCKINHAKTEADAEKIGHTAIVKYFESLGYILHWRLLKVERHQVEAEGLLLVLDDNPE